MIIDHIGYYFFPDQMGWRMVGRISMPIWMFLIGYANNRDIKLILIGAMFLLFVNLMIGLSVFPLDILFTIILIRISLDAIGSLIKKGSLYLLALFIVLTSLIPYTHPYFDYGTSAFLFAIVGYIAKNHKIFSTHFFLKCSLFYAIAVSITVQILMKPLDVYDCLLMIFSFGLSGFLLLNFKPKTYPNITFKVPYFITSTVQLIGRKTIYLYILQMVFFKIGREIIK